MTIFESVILGIVEGLTEFLPVSSTGHLILASRLLNIAQTEFVKSFEIAIQLGAICAIVALYAKRMLRNWQAIKRIIAAFVPTAIVGFAFYKIIKDTLLDSTGTVLWALAVGGVALIVFELIMSLMSFPRRRESMLSQIPLQVSPRRGEDLAQMVIASMPYKHVVFIGCFQAISVIPGVSRAAATIIGGMLAGFDRKTAVEFSFLLAVPTMAAATGYDLLKSVPSFEAADFGPLAVGFVVSFVVALVAVRWLLRFINTHAFTGFGFYRIIAALVFWIFVLK